MSILAPCGSRWLLELSEKIFDWTQRYQYQAMRADVVGSRDIASEHNERSELHIYIRRRNGLSVPHAEDDKPQRAF
jgi:hypothetical protein